MTTAGTLTKKSNTSTGKNTSIEAFFKEVRVNPIKKLLCTLFPGHISMIGTHKTPGITCHTKIYICYDGVEKKLCFCKPCGAHKDHIDPIAKIPI